MGLQSVLVSWSLPGARPLRSASTRIAPADTAVSATTAASVSTTHLDAIKPGTTATICGFSESVDPVLAQRLQDLGFNPGAEVSCLRVAPLGCPMMLRVGNADLCLRKQQARSIRITLDQR